MPVLVLSPENPNKCWMRWRTLSNSSPQITHLLELLNTLHTAFPGKLAFLDLIWKTCSKYCRYQRSLCYPSTSHSPRSLLHPCLVHGSLAHPAQCSCPCLHPGIARKKTTMSCRSSTGPKWEGWCPFLYKGATRAHPVRC